MRIVGIDSGLATFGYCIVRLGEPDVVENVQVLRTERSAEKRRIRVADDTADRISYLAGELHEVLKRTPDVVALCVEAVALPYGKLQTSVVSALGRARGIVDTLAVVHGLPVVEEQPQFLKKLATGTKSASKEDVQTALEARFPELGALWPPQKTLREHAGDAVAAALAGLQSDVVKAARRYDRLVPA